MVGREGYGNAGSMESVEKQKQLFPSFHAPLEISPKARDSHIPTARRGPGWKSGKPQAGFPLFHAGRATTAPVYSLSEPSSKRSAASRPPLYLSGSRCIENAIPNQKSSCRGGCRRGTTSSVLVAVR